MITIGYQRRIQRGCPGCPDTRPLLRVPLFEKNIFSCPKSTLNHTVCNALKCRENKSESVWTFKFSGGGPRTPLPARASPPPVPLSGGLDTRPCQILDPPLVTLLIIGLSCQTCLSKQTSYMKLHQKQDDQEDRCLEDIEQCTGPSTVEVIWRSQCRDEWIENVRIVISIQRILILREFSLEHS